MSFSPKQDKENETIKTIEWACKCLSDESQAKKRIINLSILKFCIENIDGKYDIHSVCNTLRFLLENVAQNDEIHGQAYALLIQIMAQTSNSPYNSKNMERTTASILFLDLQGFSSLKESEVTYFFEEILKDLASQKIDSCRQYIDDINTWGDGLIIIMKDPYRMARLALEIRDFYQNYDWEEKRMPQLFARIALHHGAIYRGFDHFRKTESIIGTEVTLGARLEPIVIPNEIWCTAEFKVLVKKDKDKTIDFDSLGTKEFAKGFGKFEIYRLRRYHEKQFL
jgi:class 3 adenylate cyclase